MIIGTEEKDLPVDPLDSNDVVDDLDEDTQYDRGDDSVMSVAEHRQKLEKYKALIDITFINPPRTGKKLLVLDLDFTLFDMKTQSDDYTSLKRPFTHRQLQEDQVTTNISCTTSCASRLSPAPSVRCLACRLPVCAVPALRVGGVESDVVALAGDEADGAGHADALALQDPLRARQELPCSASPPLSTASSAGTTSSRCP